MTKYKIILHYSNGEYDEEDEIFSSREKAENYGSYLCSCVDQGAEDSYLSNPGDYPLENALSAEYEIIELND